MESTLADSNSGDDSQKTVENSKSSDANTNDFSNMNNASIQNSNEDETKLKNFGLLTFRDFCVRAGNPDLKSIAKPALAQLVHEFFDHIAEQKGSDYACRALRRFRYGFNYYFRPVLGDSFDMGLDVEFEDVMTTFAGNQKHGGNTRGNRDDGAVITEEDLTKISEYFWRVINTPRGLQQKVWFDIMIHLGTEGIENQHSMRKDSFVLLKSQTDGKRRLHWKFDGQIRGPPIFEDTTHPLCPVKSFQLYVCKLNVSCTALFQRPHEGIMPTSRFWYHMFPLNTTMVALMMYDISKEAGLTRVYPNFCTQVLPMREDFYRIFRTAYRNVPTYQSVLTAPAVAPTEDGVEPQSDPNICPFKLCQQCLTPVKVNQSTQQSNKGILCSVPCFEAFQKAKELRQTMQQQATVIGVNNAAFGNRRGGGILGMGAGGRRVVMNPSIIRRGGGSQPMSREERILMGKNIPPDVYKFITQVAKIQGAGYPRFEDKPMLFNEDGTTIDAEWTMPKELLDLTVAVVNRATNMSAKKTVTPPTVSTVTVTQSTADPQKKLRVVDVSELRSLIKPRVLSSSEISSVSMPSNTPAIITVSRDPHIVATREPHIVTSREPHVISTREPRVMTPRDTSFASLPKSLSITPVKRTAAVAGFTSASTTGGMVINNNAAGNNPMLNSLIGGDGSSDNADVAIKKAESSRDNSKDGFDDNFGQMSDAELRSSIEPQEDLFASKKLSVSPDVLPHQDVSTRRNVSAYQDGGLNNRDVSATHMTADVSSAHMTADVSFQPNDVNNMMDKEFKSEVNSEPVLSSQTRNTDTAPALESDNADNSTFDSKQ